MKMTLNQMLVELDGFKPSEGAPPGGGRALVRVITQAACSTHALSCRSGAVQPPQCLASCGQQQLAAARSTSAHVRCAPTCSPATQASSSSRPPTSRRAWTRHLCGQAALTATSWCVGGGGRRGTRQGRGRREGGRRAHIVVADWVARLLSAPAVAAHCLVSPLLTYRAPAAQQAMRTCCRPSHTAGAQPRR